MSRGFTVGTWRGRPNYECALCPFSTLDVHKMAKHLEETHKLEVAVQLDGSLFVVGDRPEPPPPPPPIPEQPPATAIGLEGLAEAAKQETITIVTANHPLPPDDEWST